MNLNCRLRFFAKLLGIVMLGGAMAGCDGPAAPKGVWNEEDLKAKTGGAGGDLAGLERRIGEKEAELEEMKRQAAELRAGQAKAEAEAQTKPKSKPDLKPQPDSKPVAMDKLLADMPKDRYPRGGEDGTPERRAANEWLKTNVVGRWTEWIGTLSSLSLVEKDERSYLANITFEEAGCQVDTAPGLLVTTVKLGNESIPVVAASFATRGSGLKVALEVTVGEAKARHLRGLKGKKVRVHMSIETARFDYAGYRRLEPLSNGPSIIPGMPLLPESKEMLTLRIDPAFEAMDAVEE